MYNLGTYNGELNELQQQIEYDLGGCDDYKARNSLLTLKLKVLQEKAKANSVYTDTPDTTMPKVMENLEHKSLEELQEYFANLVR